MTLRRVPFILWFAAVGGAGVLAAQVATFHADTHTVAVYTTVLDAAGRLVTNLTRDDFEVFDNGVRQPLTAFANDLQPITIVVMLDRSESMTGNFLLVRNAAQQFVLSLDARDRARIGSFSTRVRIDPDRFTSDRDELLRILRDDLLPPGATALWNGTAEAMTALARESGRRVVLLFTDGYDSPATLATNLSFSDVLAQARSEETMVYAIGFSDGCSDDARTPPAAVPHRPLYQRRLPGGRGGGGPVGPIPIYPPAGPRPAPNPDPFGRNRAGGGSGGDGCRPEKPDPGLAVLAAESGGGYFELHGSDNLAATFTRVAAELHHQYLLAFAAPVLDGASHAIDVRVRNPALTARGRKTYLAR